MSVIATVFIPEGIVMASDSRITGTRILNNENIIINEVYTISDNGQKVFLLSKRPFGISVCGAMEIVGQTIADFIREFEITHVKSEDTVQQVAESLKSFVHQKEADVNIVFHIAGYDDELQKIYRINGDTIQLNENHKYGANWDGDINYLTDLVNGNTPMYFDWDHMYLKDGIEFAEFMIDVNCKAQRFSTGVATCGGSIDILLLTKDEARWIKHKILNP